jgi:hypothetical protein
MSYFGPLEGRSGGTGRGKEPLPISQNQLAVGADINDKQHFVLVIRLFGDEHADVIRPDESRFYRQDVNVSARRYLEPQVARFDIYRVMYGGSERCLAKMTRVDIEEEMVYAGVADNCHVDDIRAFDARLFGYFTGNLIQPFDDGIVQPFQAILF